MSVHYKFKSSLDYDTVTFDGLHISVSDLKKSITQQKKIGKSSDFDLQITNAQTKEVYDNDEALVPKNTSVIVARVPFATASKKTWERSDIPVSIQDIEPSSHMNYDKLIKTADLANANATEDEKIKAMMNQSSQEFDPSKYVKSRSMTGPLPPNYTCYRCGKQGHWIKNCPTNNPEVKRSTGIPRSFMVPVDGPDHKGALLTSTGDYAVPLIDHAAYKEVKKEKPPFLNLPEPELEPEHQIPEELLCSVCKDLLQDAVLIPCCGDSFCDECVRQVLLDSENHECPVCHEVGISPDTLIPNRFLRSQVQNFKNKTGYIRIKSFLPPVPDSVKETTASLSPPPPLTDVNQNTTIASDSAFEKEKLEDQQEDVEMKSPKFEEDNEVKIKAEINEVSVLEIKSDDQENVVDQENDKVTEETLPPHSVKQEVDTPENVADESKSMDKLASEELPNVNLDQMEEKGIKYSDNLKENKNTLELEQQTECEEESQNHELLQEKLTKLTVKSELDSIPVCQSPLPPGEDPVNIPVSIVDDEAQPGTPLADEPPVDIELTSNEVPQDHHLIKMEAHGVTEHPQYHPYPSENMDSDSREGITTLDNARTIMTITTERTRRQPNSFSFPMRRHAAPVREPPRSSSHGQRQKHHSRPRYRSPASRDRDRNRDYLSANYRLYPEYTSHHPPETTPQGYESSASQQIPHGVTQRYSVQTSQHRMGLPSGYGGQGPPRTAGPPHTISQSFPAQPPPPGSSPLSHVTTPSGQPPPPGIGPLIPPPGQLPPHHHGPLLPAPYSKPFASEEYHRDIRRMKERGVGDPLDDFARQFLEVDPEHRRSHSRRRPRARSHSSSDSRSYSTSKSWSRSGSRTSRSWSRSRSHSFSYSSRSRSRSYSRSRSRSRSRSYSRSPHSRSRSRSYHSRSRSRSRDRHRDTSHYIRPHSRSPKGYRHSQRISPIHHKKDFSSSYYGTSHSGLNYSTVPTSTSAPSSHSHLSNQNLENYDSRYYHSHYRNYDSYHSMFTDSRYDPRDPRHDSKHSQDYQKRIDNTHYKSQGKEKEKVRDNDKSKGRDNLYKKDISKTHSPKILESKDNAEDKNKKKEEKLKHKKHHHHRNKEGKKERAEAEEIKSSRIITDKHSTASSNLVKIEVVDTVIEPKKSNIQEVSKEKKHKHKKRKDSSEEVKKKSKVLNAKEGVKFDGSAGITKTVKVKKKREKVKIPLENKEENIISNEIDQEPLVQGIPETVSDFTDKMDTITEQIAGEEMQISSLNELKPNTDLSNTEEMEIISPSSTIPTEQSDVIDNVQKNASVGEGESEEDLLISESQETTDDLPDAGELEDIPVDVLHVEVPAMSKWEREEYDDMEDTRYPSKISLKEKISLSSDIIQRAEKAILQKPLKAAITEVPLIREKHKTERKMPTDKQQRLTETNKDSFEEPKDGAIIKQRTESPILQITITADKEKRCVQTKKKEKAEESLQNRKPKLDRSKFTEKIKDDSKKPSSKIIVNEKLQVSLDMSKENVNSGKRKVDQYSKTIMSKKGKDEKHSSDKPHSSQLIITKSRPSLKDETHFSDEKRRAIHLKKHDFGTREEILTRNRDEKRLRDYRSERFSTKSERLRPLDKMHRLHREKSRSTSRDSKRSHSSERRVHRHRVYPEMYDKREHKDVSSSKNSNDNVFKRNRITDFSEGRSHVHHVKGEICNRKIKDISEKSIRDHNEYSPLRGRKESTQDESKFEPNYDEMSDSNNSSDPETSLSVKKSQYQVPIKKRKGSPYENETTKKHLKKEAEMLPSERLMQQINELELQKVRNKVEKREKSSSSSSSSDSVSLSNSDAESVEVEQDSRKKLKGDSPEIEHKHKHKKSKHKKHKKHKHKHKKKKSHKSRQKDL